MQRRNVFPAAIAAAFSLGCVFAPMGSAFASTTTSEITDMWGTEGENGWGVNITLQNDVAFATFFVYDANRNPVWFTSDMRYQGSLLWSGGLFQSHGPWYGGPYDATTVTTRPAGSARFALTDLNHAQFTYAVDGVFVTEMLTRATWTNENFSGSYTGGYSLRSSACSPSAYNGIDEVAGVINIEQTGTNVAMSLTSSDVSCSYSGIYSQTGKLGQMQGSYTCSNGTHGSFTSYEMTPTISGFTARIAGQSQYCQWSGFMGGIARAQ
jgi:hypothetical protein